jgi:CubicO group peptidase (beta-lactamase class C family)
MIAFIVLWLCGHSLASCGQAGHSYYPDDAWRTSTPEEQGVDSKYLVAMLRNIQSAKLDLHSLLIIRNGYMISEVYWEPYHRGTTHDIKSASKSIMSALVGIALEKKSLKGLDQKITEFFPEYVDEPLKKDISLRDLLTMRSGLNWQEGAGPSPFDIKNWRMVSMRDKPGGRFEYNTALPHMMSAILTKTSKTSTRDFAGSFLFSPLGVKGYEWKKGDDGYYCGGSEIFMTPRDMAKFGYLFLRNGSWSGVQVVPSSWIRESTSGKVKLASGNGFYTGLDYGYWWWVQEKAYMAWGAGGQYIIVRPDLDLVVVITANSFDKINRYQDFFKSFLEQNIYSAAKSDSPLPADRSAVRELLDIARQLEYPKELPGQPLPLTAATISHRHYVLEPNGMGLKSVGLSCGNNDECTWNYSRGEKEVHMRIGLRGNYLINTTDFSMGVRPGGEVIACKGYWKDGNTFVIEHHLLGDPSKQVFELGFIQRKVTMHIYAMGIDATIRGRAAE